MNKDINYSGLSAVPSDYECPDGDMTGMIGLIPENGALKPILPPTDKYSTSGGGYAVYIHKTSQYCHHIWKKTGLIGGNAQKISFYFVDDKNGSEIGESTEFFDIISQRTHRKEFYQINSIGNTLLILTSEGMNYFLWKEDEGTYVNLGTHIPELPISFGLQGEMVRGEFVSWDQPPMDFLEFPNDKKQWAVSEINKFIADKATNAGKFVFPFFVRYALRLYDGTLTQHSAPIFMLKSTRCNPDIYGHSYFNPEYQNNADCYGTVCGFVCSLDYTVTLQDSLEQLKQFKDLVVSVDVFISKPIYTYDQNALDKAATKARPNVTYNLRPVFKNTKIENSLYCAQNPGQLFKDGFQGDLSDFTFDGPLRLFQRPLEEIEKDIVNCSQFYFLKSIKIDELKTERTIIEIPDDYLQSLVTREVMTDDYKSHETLVPKYSFVYNQRINLAGISKKAFNGFYLASSFCYFDDMSDEDAREVSVKIAIKKNGHDFVVAADGTCLLWGCDGLYYYYPDTDAYKVYIEMGNPNAQTVVYYEFPLKPHDFLNGAYVFISDYDNTGKADAIPQVTKDNTWEEYNKLYTSEVNNPFLFPLTGINTIGTGDIIGICSAVKALSQGQFGQFPLYVFSTDGIWAMEVSATGTYSTRQPVSRDVCINPESITQVDDAVLFVTDRGIMLIAGAESQCISDVIDMELPFSISDLPKGDKVAEMSGLAGGELDFISFREFLGECRMIYDYANQRLIVYNPSCSYAYVYSFESKSWGMMQSDIHNGINSYPEAWAMTNNYKLVDLSHGDTNASVKGIAVSRPLKLDAPDLLKTIDVMIQRGHFRRGNVATVLWGSRDLYNWQLIYSSKDHYLRGFRGTPYKYFRIALICNLEMHESISGCSVQFTPRMLDRPR